MRKILTAALFSACILSTSALYAGGGGSSSGPLAGSYPIVMGHGILGFDDSQGLAFGLGQYWGGMDDYLRDEGVAVLTPGKTAAAGLEQRARQQADQIAMWMAANGFSKVHYIGHSQGGLDGRYMISNNLCSGSYCMKNVVSTYTSLNSLHDGTPIADIALGVIPNWLEPGFATIVNFFAGLFYMDNDQDVLEMASSLSVSVANSFNANTPDAPGVKYYSYGSYMTMVDLIQHPLMSLAHPFTWAGGLAYGMGGKNDGVVPYSSQRWGTWKGGPSYGWLTTGVDHLQATNFQFTGQLFYDVEAYYLKMAKNMKNNQ